MPEMHTPKTSTQIVARWILGGMLAFGALLAWLAPSAVVGDTLAQIFGTPNYLPIIMREATHTPSATPTATITPTPTATFVPSGLALNGNFEAADNGTGSGVAAWSPWWAEIAKPPSGYDYAYKPNSFNRECKSGGAAADFVYAGDCSVRVLNNWDPWWAGIRQSVSVTPGQKLRLTAYGRAWASALFYPNPSDTTVSVEMRVGIAPSGNCDPFAGGIVWSGVIVPHNGWQQASVETNAGSGGVVCLFLSTDYRGDSRQFMASFWDSVYLAAVP